MPLGEWGERRNQNFLPNYFSHACLMFHPKFSLANAQKQTYLQDFPHTSGTTPFFLFPHSLLKLCSSLLLLSKKSKHLVADDKGCRCSQLMRNTQTLNVVPSSLGAPNCHWGWLYKCSNHHQTFSQMEIDTWSIQRSLHYHICLFGSVFKFILLLYHPSSFMFSGMQR